MHLPALIFSRLISEATDNWEVVEQLGVMPSMEVTRDAEYEL